jgi:hypothetical protein
MANAASVRNLVAGSGTVSVTALSKLLTFSGAQSFKEGATVVVDPAGTAQYFTIDTGTGTSWQAMQNAATTAAGKSFNVTDPGTGRNRGTGPIIPDAAHFLYRAVLDNSGNQDYYLYVDTVFPEKGLHPHTRDQYAGNSMSSAKAQQAFIADLATRVRQLEGILRYNGGTNDGHILLSDQRLRVLETTVFGSAKTPTLQQQLDLGDA